eukprot:3452068-Lingulodinium_polyedra.AAC.1
MLPRVHLRAAVAEVELLVTARVLVALTELTMSSDALVHQRRGCQHPTVPEDPPPVAGHVGPADPRTHPVLRA